jgi:inhibitor of cysteine peptidase
MALIVLSRAHAGTTHPASVGDTVTIQLPENPTTGYRWQVIASGSLTPCGDDFAPSAAVGAEGMRTLRFTVTAAGMHQLRLAQAREWESATTPQDQLIISIKAQ